MTKRRKAREVALQLLFERDRNTQPMSPPMAEAFAKDRLVGEAASIRVPPTVQPDDVRGTL